MHTEPLLYPTQIINHIFTAFLICIAFCDRIGKKLYSKWMSSSIPKLHQKSLLMSLRYTLHNQNNYFFSLSTVYNIDLLLSLAIILIFHAHPLIIHRKLEVLFYHHLCRQARLFQLQLRKLLLPIR